MKIISCIEETILPDNGSALKIDSIEVKIGRIFLLFTKFDDRKWFLEYTSACSHARNENTFASRRITAPYFIAWLNCQIEEYKNKRNIAA